MEDKIKKYRKLLTDIDVETFKAKPGVSTAYMLDIMYDEAVSMNPKVIVELGVRRGISTVAFEHVAKACDSKLISIDFRDCSSCFCKWDKWIFLQIKSQIAGRNWKTICKKNSIEQDKIDVIFIDTSHTYNDTKTNIEIWKENLNKKHKWIFHDTNPTENPWKYGVKQAIVEWLEEDWDATVYVNKYLKNGYHLINYPQEHGLLILERE